MTHGRTGAVSTRLIWAIGVVGVLVVLVLVYPEFREGGGGTNPSQGTVGAGSPEGAVPAAMVWSLPEDHGTMILVRHTNAQAVAEASLQYWREMQGTTLEIVSTTEPMQLEAGWRFLVLDPYNGVVEIDGPVEWKAEEEQRYTAMAMSLSKTLNTTAVAALIGPQAQSGTFGVYEQGQQRFFVRRTLTQREPNLLQAVVHVDGEAWAKSQAPFAPESGTYRDFTMLDANALAHAIGINLVGAPLPESCWVLKE